MFGKVVVETPTAMACNVSVKGSGRRDHSSTEELEGMTFG
jgi:hypothetical protein